MISASLPDKVFPYAQNRLGKEMVWDNVADYSGYMETRLYCTYSFVTATNLSFYSVQATYVEIYPFSSNVAVTIILVDL